MNNDIVKLSKEKGDLEFINISNSLAVAKISLQGGHVVWWKPKSIKEDVLWLSTNARYEKGRSIRGGVPICWPWFGHHPTDGTYCAHGFNINQYQDTCYHCTTLSHVIKCRCSRVPRPTQICKAQT
jgi:glucose-6-phosphate 1-epimerase